MRFVKYLNEGKTLSEFALEFRKKLEAYHDGDLAGIDGTCQSEAEQLAKFLKTKGFAAEKVGGYYKNLGDDWESPDGKPATKWKHWWVLVDNKTIVDVTADQFHPSERQAYRVVITNKQNRDY